MRRMLSSNVSAYKLRGCSIVDATYYQKALKSKLLVLAGAAAIALGLCLAPRPVLASELIGGGVEPIVSYSCQADAGMPSPLSWYGDDLSLSGTYSFQDRYFDSNNVGIEMTASCPSSGTFTVSLYRVVNGRGTLVGSASFKRRGFTKATWEGVGSGTYRFVCKKPADGKVVTSSDVAMYSW